MALSTPHPARYCALGANPSLTVRFIRGFSLIELLVVIAIIGILTTITWSSLPRLMAHYRLDGAARALMADAQRARFRAIAERKCFQMKLDSPVPAGSFEIRTDTNIGNCGGAAYTVVDSSRKIDADNALTVTVTPSTANPIFNTRGTVLTTATITLTNIYGASRQVRIEATGRIRIS